ncbi:unnamed protein product [Lymnaea stagnalis]|uniref:AIG1-type G domain-containing protein n=1 Tax=Lymnaea stagnalis TaxID=6523 RepID=A0AAV2GWP1_LYMST
MGAADSKLNLLLIGKTGSGKSSSGNAIAGEQVYETFSTSTSCTRRVKSCNKFRWGRQLTLVDTPGLMDTSMNDNEIEQCYFARRVIQDAFKIPETGFHAIIIVLNYIERYSNEDIRVTNMLKEIFGTNLYRFTILLFTHGDNFDQEYRTQDNARASKKRFAEWCDETQGDLRVLLQQCNFRAVLFHNNPSYRGDRDVEFLELLRHAECIKRSNKEYTKSNFAGAQRTRDKLILTTCLAELKAKINSELRTLRHDFELMRSQRGIIIERANEVFAALSNNNVTPFPNSSQVFNAVTNLVTNFNDNLTNGEKFNILNQLQTIIDCPSLQKLKLLSQDVEILLSPEKHKFQLRRRINELLQHIEEEAHGTDMLEDEKEMVTFFLSEVVSFDITATTTIEIHN